jgi:hypothetical protein
VSDDAADVQRDNELSATAEDAAGAVAREMQKDIHTSLPGQIVSFDAATQTATVKPLIQRQLVDGTVIDIPDCQDVPVHHPRGGNIAFTFPVAAGDECLLCFSERAIDFWHENGGAQLPSEYRMHDYSDAFAFVGFSSKPNAIKNVATDAAELRTLDGKTRIRLEADMVTAGDLANAVAAVRADVLNLIIQALASHVHPVTVAVSGAVGTGTSLASPQLTSLPDPSAKNVRVS